MPIFFFSCLKVLLEHGGFVNQADQSGWTPLHWAAYNGHSECCQVLLQYGARLDAVTSVRCDPFLLLWFKRFSH